MKNFWGKLFQRKKIEEIAEEENWDDVVYRRGNVSMHDTNQRKTYIDSCLTQMKEASEELDKLTGEYQTVTAYLTDMEEVDALPIHEKREVAECALKIVNLAADRNKYIDKKDRLSDSKFDAMERLEDEALEGIQKLEEAEKYQNLVKQDLTKLDGEKHAYRYRNNELKVEIANDKGMSVICFAALGSCFLILLIMQFVFELETQIGYLITAGVAAISITYLYVRYHDAVQELKQVERSINRITTLQNTVKIRYVNNKNLLDYLCLKYQVKNSAQFRKEWEKYQSEKEERQKYKQLEEELDYNKRQLLHLLRKYRVKFPEIWLHQAAAIIDNKEMVEIRHGLILRRQELRKQMDYNRNMAEMAQKEITEVVKEFPQYAREIMDFIGKTGE